MQQIQRPDAAGGISKRLEYIGSQFSIDAKTPPLYVEHQEGRGQSIKRLNPPRKWYKLKAKDAGSYKGSYLISIKNGMPFVEKHVTSHAKWVFTSKQFSLAVYAALFPNYPDDLKPHHLKDQS